MRELIKTLRQDITAVRGLEGEAFQDLVFWIIKEWLLGMPNKGERVQRITNFLRGEIDIVLEVKPDFEGAHAWPPKTESRRRLHFVECKNYDRALELDRVGKAYCAAIRYEPESLTIVSSSYLPPQAVDYAQAFFSTEAGKTGLCKHTLFRHLTIEDLLNLLEEEEGSLRKSAPTQPAVAFFQREEGSQSTLVDWEIVVDTPWGAELVARRDANPSEVVLRSSSTVRLSVWLEGSSADLDPSEVDLIDGDGQEVKISSFGVSRWQSNIQRLTWEVTPAMLSRLGGREVLLRTRLPSLESVTAIASLPVVIVRRDTSLFRDLRPTLTGDLVKSLRLDSEKRVLFLHGSAGVGKTFLAERLASELKESANWRVERLTVNSLTSPALFLKLIWRTLFPTTSRDRAKSSDPVPREILRAFLGRAVGAHGDQSTEELVARLASWDLRDVEMDVLTHLSASILSEDPRPLLYVLSNCHALSPSILNGLQNLFRSLEDNRWGGIRFILEYRDTQDEVTQHWEEFVTRLQSDFPTSVVKRHVPPLEAREVQVGIAREFSQPDSAKVTEKLVRKAGGNPLFLTQVMLLLLDQGVVSELSPQKSPWRFAVEDHSKFSARLRELPDAVESLLRRRIRFILDSKSEDSARPPRRDLVNVLAAGAVLNGFSNAKAIQTAASLGDDQLRRCCWFLMDARILRASVSAPLGDFAHELVEEASLRECAEEASFKPLMHRLESTLKRRSIEESLLGGKISLLLGDPDGAQRWYNTAYELATGRRNFVAQRSSLAGLLESLSAEVHSEVSKQRRHLAVKQELAFWEIMTGSQIEARRLLRELLEETRIAEPGLDPTEYHSVRLEAYFSLLTLLARKRAIGDFLACCESAVQEASHLQHVILVLTRFTIIAGVCNHPEAAHAASVLALQVASSSHNLAPVSDDMDVLSVVLHDTGDLFLAAEPKEALRLFAQSLDNATSPRQLLNCRVTLAMAHLHAAGKFLETESLDKLTAELSAAKISNLNVRWDLYRGVQAFSLTDMEESLFFFRRAVDRALSANLTLHEWQGLNNIAVVYASLGHNRTATEYFLRALLRTEEVLEYLTVRRSRISSSLETIEHSLSRFPEWKSANGALICDLPGPPAYSGQVVSLAWNISEWSRAGVSDTNLDYWRHRLLGRKMTTGIRRPNLNLKAQAAPQLFFTLE